MEGGRYCHGGRSPTIRPQLACLTGSNTRKSHISTLRDNLAAATSYYRFECGSLNLSKHQMTALPGGPQGHLQKHLVQTQSYRCSGAMLALSQGCWRKCSVQLHINLLSDCMCVPTHSCGLIHRSAVFSRHNLIMSSPHCHGLRYTATKHMHTHLIWQQKQQCLLGRSIQTESLRGKPATPITWMPLRAFVSIVITRYLLVHAPANSFSTKWVTF